AALFEIEHECGGGLIGFGGLAAYAVGQTAVMVPALVVELNESYAALSESSGEQGVGGGRTRRAAVVGGAIKGGIWFGRDVGHMRHARLYAGRHFVLRDARFDFGIELFFELVTVECIELFEHRAAAGATDAVGIAEIQDWVFAGAELNALVFRIKEPAPPET